MTDYVKELLAINPSYDPDLLEKAYAKASQLHEGQLRKSGEPYREVVLVVARLVRYGLASCELADGKFLFRIES